MKMLLFRRNASCLSSRLNKTKSQPNPTRVTAEIIPFEYNVTFLEGKQGFAATGCLRDPWLCIERLAYLSREMATSVRTLVNTNTGRTKDSAEHKASFVKTFHEQGAVYSNSFRGTTNKATRKSDTAKLTM